jgi:hypothetical protein
LAEAFLERPHSYEPIQGARVLPIFEQLGSQVELLDRIGGLREQCLETINPERRNPDPGLFKILTALLSARDAWPTVELIPRSRQSKPPRLKPFWSDLNNQHLRPR